MLEVNVIRADKARVADGLRKRNLSQEEIEKLDTIISLDDRRKEIQSEIRCRSRLEL